METLITTLVPFLLPLLLLIGCAVFLFHHHSSTNQRRGGGILPPGSRGWPLIGETLRLVSALKSDNPETFTNERVRRFGRLFTSHLLFEPTVLSTDPEFNRILFNGDGRSFENSMLPTIVNLLGPHALINLTGTLHKRMRSLTLARFSASSVMKDSLLPDIDRHVRRILNSWQDGERVVLTEQTRKMGFGILIKKLINENPGEWTDALRREYIDFVGGFVAIPLPFSFTKYGRALRARTKVREELLGVVKRRKAAINAAKGKKAEDLLDELIMMEDGLDEEGMVDFLVSLLVGGYDITSAAMTVAVKFITENPRALACLREEHEQIRRSRNKKLDQQLEWSDYQAMTFTQWVINETLRIANISPGLHRRATTDIHYKGYTIPKGCKVSAWIRAVHLDSEIFEDASSFNPWRWENAKSESVSLLNPFGGGHRLCPGYKLARLEIAVFLHYLVSIFEWDVTEKDKLIYFPIAGTLKGYPIIVRRKTLDC